MLKFTGALLAAGLSFAAQALAADAPAEIKIGTLYASSGRFASISMPVHSALKLWIDQKNADGGVYVKAFDKKIPVKLVAYDDQSNTATASTLRQRLWRNRIEGASIIIDRAVLRSELPAGTDAEALLETMIAPLYLRVLLDIGPLDQAVIDRAVHAALAGR